MDPSLTLQQIEYILQFQHPQKMLSGMPGISPAVVAQLFEIDQDLLTSTQAKFASAAQVAAVELLADEALAQAIDRLPFTDGQTVVALADSITDDWQSWFEILRHMIALRLPTRGLQLVNCGISGDTTTHAICRFLEIVQHEPDWILCFLGTNDCRRHGLASSKVLVSPEETAKNYEMLRQFGATQTSAEWVWLTPGRVIEELIPAHWLLGPVQLTWRNAEMDTVAEIVRSRPEAVIDLQPLFTNAKDLLLDDGLHPALSGQKAICRQVVTQLAQ